MHVRVGITDLRKVYTERELAPADDLFFVATGATEGAFMRGVRFFGGGSRTSSIIMSLRERHIRFVDTVHVDEGSDVVVEF